MDYITGASGFIGKRLATQLDDATAIPSVEVATKNLAPFDRFFFLSAYGNMADHDDVVKICRANVSDPLAIIKQAVRHDFKSFVFASTSSVKLRNQTMYSRTKRAAEEILLAFTEKYGKPICIVRPFSVTGVGEQPNHLIPTLIRACRTGEPVNLTITPTHDFIDVEDVVAGILSLADHQAKGIFELGTGTKYTNGEVLKIVENVTGKKANVNVVSGMRAYDNDGWVSTNFRSRSYGWLPRKSLEQSVAEMVEAYDKATK